jgi:hypothetical protein
MPRGRRPGLPTCIVVGAMKCGTTALHRQLDLHPEIAMARVKELNFFFGPGTAPHERADEWWRTGQWHRGLGWYAAQHDGCARVRGESSPGYTDPAHDEVPARMHLVVPDVRLVYLVRDPVARAVSQWRHHTRDGTEQRALEDAVLDPASQYLARSRYAERVAPFLEHFPQAQLLVVVQERLLADPRTELARVYDHVGADPTYWTDALAERVHVGDGPEQMAPPPLARAVWDAVAGDVTQVRRLVGDPLPEWPDPRDSPDEVITEQDSGRGAAARRSVSRAAPARRRR